jgi:hypothetical protein
MIALLYLFSIPIVNAFNISSIFVIPLLISLINSLYMIVTNQFKRLIFLKIDIFILIFLSFVLISVLLNINSLSLKTINHMGAIFASFIFFYYAVEISLRGISLEKVLKILYYSYIFTAIFGIAEFYIVNFTTLDLNSVVFHASVEEYTPSFLALFIRSRSFFAESGHWASYMAVLSPIMFYYLWYMHPRATHKIFFISVSITSYFVAFSTSLFLFLPLSIFIGFFLKQLIDQRISLKSILVYFLLICCLFYFMNSDLLMQGMVLDKLGSNSFDDRNEKFLSTMILMYNSDILNLLFGYSPGSYEILNIKPAISVYANFFRDVGLLGVLIYIFTNIYLLFKILKLNHSISIFLFISSLVSQLFFIGIPDYFYPHFFLCLILYKKLVNQSYYIEPFLKTNTESIAKKGMRK